MADYVTKVRTREGDKQIDYEALANRPIENGKATQLITLYDDPTKDMHAATKKYVDQHAGGKVPVLSEDPTNPAEGEMWILYTEGEGE